MKKVYLFIMLLCAGISTKGQVFYEIEVIDQSTRRFSNPSINNLGQIVYSKQRDVETGYDGFLYDNNNIIKICELGILTSISDTGYIAASMVPYGNAIHVYKDGQWVEVFGANATPFLHTSNWGHGFYTRTPIVNNHGEVATFGFENKEVGFYRGDGNTTVKVTSGLSMNSYGARPSINNQGQVSFAGSFVGEPYGGIYVGDGELPITTIYPGGPSTTHDGSSFIVINDLGMVAINRFLDSWYVAVGDGSAELDIIGQGLFERTYTPDLNNMGDIAFNVRHEDLTRGIYVLLNENIHPVLKVGDILDSATIIDIRIDNGAFNGNRDLVFWAKLDNGQELIGKATYIPEPATLSLLAIGSLLAIRRKRS